MKKITIFLCSMIMLVFTAQMCFASEYVDVEIGGKISDELKEEEIGVVNWTPVVELWHYSGGYWGSN